MPILQSSTVARGLACSDWSVLRQERPGGDTDIPMGEEGGRLSAQSQTTLTTVVDITNVTPVCGFQPRKETLELNV